MAPTRRGGPPWAVARALGGFDAGRLDVLEGATRCTVGDPAATPAARVEIHESCRLPSSKLPAHRVIPDDVGRALRWIFGVREPTAGPAPPVTASAFDR